MKKILFFLLLINSFIVYSQSPIRLPSKIVRQTWNGDTAQTTVNTDSINYYTNTSRFSFNKPVYIQGSLIGSNVVKSGPFLKSQGDTTLIPYTNQGETPGKEAFYWGAGYGGLTIDTTIVGQSTDNHGIVGYSINSNGIYGESQNGNGGRFITNSGYNHLLVGDAGDSVAIRLDGTIHQYYNGNEIFSVNTSGFIAATRLNLTNAGLTLSYQEESIQKHTGSIISDLYFYNNGHDHGSSLLGIVNNDGYANSKCVFKLDTARFLVSNDDIKNPNDRFQINSNGTIENWHSGIKKIMTDTSGFIYHKMPDAFLYRSTDTTINITQNIWYKFGPLGQKGIDGITVQRDSAQLIYPGDYSIKFIISLTGLNNEVWEGGIFKNSVLEEPSQFNKTVTTDEKQLVVETEVTSDGNDWVTFKIRNTTDNDDITIRKIAIKIVTNHLTIP